LAHSASITTPGRRLNISVFIDCPWPSIRKDVFGCNNQEEGACLFYGEEAPQQPEVAEKVTTTSAQTSAAVSKARQAVVPPAKAVVKQSMPARTAAPVKPKASVQVDKNSWMLGSHEG
jgi:hypothetical protein